MTEMKTEVPLLSQLCLYTNLVFSSPQEYPAQPSAFTEQKSITIPAWILKFVCSFPQHGVSSHEIPYIQNELFQVKLTLK